MADFSAIIGQEHIKEQLGGSVDNDTISHAYIFSGEKGLGKKHMAKLFSMAIQCEGGKKGNRPCMECRSCRLALGNNHPDIKYFLPEKEKSIGVRPVRKQIVDDVYIKPYSSRYKVYIMKDADKMTLAAQNVLLKTLEEPPSYTVLILITDNISSIIPTIISRCVVLSMKPLKDSAVRDYLMDELHISEYQAGICSAFARGNIGRARSLALNDSFGIIREDTVRILKDIKDMDMETLIGQEKIIQKRREAVNEFFDIITIWYRDVLMYKATGDKDAIVFKEEEKSIRKAAERSSYEGIERVMEKLDITKERLKANVKFALAIELLLLTIKEN
ncbi:MAG: DNA polymerase III subunit delta [Lachnospiraceae bacterium]|nr:DNA polymerase III subunit delta [Lachnospiraceae bacterium]